MRRRLLSYDIHRPSLLVNATKNDERNIFQASSYQQPFPKNSIQAVIGYSSFDAYLYLNKVFFETARVLKKGGKLILFQDLLTDVYNFERKLSGKERVETVERYHAVLVDEAEKVGFKILGGREDYLEVFEVESAKNVRKRVSDLELNARPFPVIVSWDRGIWGPLIRTESRENAGVTKESVDEAISKIGAGLKEGLIKNIIKGLNAKPGDLITRLKIRYLVAEKF